MTEKELAQDDSRHEVKGLGLVQPKIDWTGNWASVFVRVFLLSPLSLGKSQLKA